MYPFCRTRGIALIFEDVDEPHRCRESLGRAHEAFPHNNGREVQPARNSDRSPAQYANDSEEDVEIDDEPEEQ